MTQVLLFWLIAVAMTALALALVVPRLRSRRTLALIVGIALPALAFGVYALYGDPTAIEPFPGDEPAAGATPHEATVGRDELVRHLARNARDGRAWVLLARIDFDADRFTDAATAYAKALDASPKVAADPAIWCEYADALGMAQGGSLAGKPRELIERALALSASHPKALEMAGSAAYGQGDYEGAVRNWRMLLAQLPAGSQRYRELAAAIERAERMTVAGTPAAESAR
jgi:cytochrome c-type biogenesis protein CcmH